MKGLGATFLFGWLALAPVAFAQAPAASTAPAAQSAPAAASGRPEAADPHAGLRMNPHGQLANPHGELPQDSNEDAHDLPAGTIEVVVADGSGQRLAGVDVRLGILSQKISEGETRSSQTAKTGAEGQARFTGLGVTADKSYRVTVPMGGAEYASTPFNLRDSMGRRVVLHVFPATSDIAQTRIGMRGFLYVETRDDVFQLEAIFRVFNLGRNSWIPNDVVMTLPEGFKAFNASESMFDAKFEAVEGRGARLNGTFPPGQRDVSFRFQIPKPTESTVSFNVGLLPRLAEVRVIAVASAEMSLEVEPGFEAPQVASGPRGDRVLVTRWLVPKGGPELSGISVTLAGLRVPGPGRWVAVFIALGFAGLGVLAARGDLRIASTERVQSDRVRARELILSELVAVERAKESGALGPNAYERTHRALLDALARIGIPEAKRRPKRRAESRRVGTTS